jgi:Ion channel
MLDNEGWSLYGAQPTQPVATAGKWDDAENVSDKRKRCLKLGPVAAEFPWDGMWWAVVTVTTVGYGDLYPETFAGRVIAMGLMLVGIGFISVLTAALATRFIQTDTQSDEVLETLHRIEADIAELKAKVG